jgi:hypothetical protein
LQGANLSSAQLQGAYLIETQLQAANLMSVGYGEYINPETKESSPTNFQIDYDHEKYIHCLTNDYNLPIFKKYSKIDTDTLNKITDYWINDLSCYNKYIAQIIIGSYLNSNEFKDYLIKLLNDKLADKTCLGIQNLPDEIKQEIRQANKPTNKK